MVILSETYFDLKDENVDQFFGLVDKVHGYDFTNYSKSHLKRRLIKLANVYSATNLKELEVQVESNTFLNNLKKTMTVQVSEFFRDPEVYKCIVENVFPLLKSCEPIKVWHAGCAEGEEVYSLAILLHEAGLLQKTILYATDLSPYAIHEAKEGVYDTKQIKHISKRYLESGGNSDFSDYYHANYGKVMIKPFLKRNIVFSQHNLVCDQVFSEMHLIFCRNVLIYFNKKLQDRVLQLLDSSLMPSGILTLGDKESLKSCSIKHKFQSIINSDLKVFQKLNPNQVEHVLR